MPYDQGNVFAKILRGEVPCRAVYEDAWALAFHDLSPQAPVHVLVVPKGLWTSLADFTAGASSEEIAGVMRAVGMVARQLGVDDAGWRVLANCGAHAGQEVPHLHFHLVAGRPLGRMLAAP